MTPNVYIDHANLIYPCYDKSEETNTFNVFHLSSFEDTGKVDCSCQTSITHQQKSKQRKSVSFSILEIREHALIIGDHPYCTTGLPLSLDWGHSRQTHVLNIDEYEGRRAHRRSGINLKTTYLERKNLLKRVAGLREIDIKRSIQRAR